MLLLIPALLYLAHHSWASLNPTSRSLPTSFYLFPDLKHPNNPSFDLGRPKRLYMRNIFFINPGCWAIKVYWTVYFNVYIFTLHKYHLENEKLKYVQIFMRQSHFLYYGGPNFDSPNKTVKHDIIIVKHDIMIVWHNEMNVKHNIVNVKHDIMNVKHNIMNVINSILWTLNTILWMLNTISWRLNTI